MNRHFQFTFVGEKNHRKAGSLGAAFIDWLMANPGSTSAQIKSAGHDLKHLRWDINHNPKLIQIVDGLTGVDQTKVAEEFANDGETLPQGEVSKLAEELAEKAKQREEPIDLAAEFEELTTLAEEIKDELLGLRDQEQEYFDNMPESFQNGEKGENAQTEIDAMEEAISQLEEVAGLAL